MQKEDSVLRQNVMTMIQLVLRTRIVALNAIRIDTYRAQLAVAVSMDKLGGTTFLSGDLFEAAYRRLNEMRNASSEQLTKTLPRLDTKLDLSVPMRLVEHDEGAMDRAFDEYAKNLGTQVEAAYYSSEKHARDMIVAARMAETPGLTAEAAAADLVSGQGDTRQEEKK